MAFRDELVASSGPGWERYLGHPFFVAIADGSLTRAQFRFWLEQDLPYVEEYGRARAVLAERVAASPAFADLASGLDDGSWAEYAGEQEVGFEVEMLRRIGVDAGRVDRFDALPAREGYMNHVARTVLEGTPGQIACALLPCEWGFTEMAARLAPTCTPGLDPVYADWIAYYTTPEQVRNTDLSLSLVERAAEVADDAERELMRKVFRRSVQHQIAVIDAAYVVADPWYDERPVPAVAP